jgi:alkylation response protein AidB-like acyl-CoA dehydrogenase
MTSTTADPAELEMLRLSARRLMEGAATLDQAAEMGLLGLLTAEDRGGSGWRPVEACAVAAESGRALSPLVWMDSLVAAAALSGDETPSDVVAGLVAGDVTAAVVRPAAITPTGSDRFDGRLGVAGRAAPDLLVAFEGTAARLIDCRPAEVRFEGGDGLDTTRPNGVLTVRGGKVIAGGPAARPVADAAVLVACADSVGALGAIASLLREYLSGRTAFDRPLASFQVIQHRLADLTVLESAGRAMVDQAAGALAAGDGGATDLICATHSYLARHLIPALDDSIQLSGGIGFTWEFPPHHALRRVTTNASWVRPARASLGRLVLGRGIGDEPAADPFRRRVRQVIATRAPFEAREGHRAPENPEQEAALRKWYADMYREGLAGAGWPEEWGGDPDHRPVHDLIVTEELIRARAPRPLDQCQLASHLIIGFGSADHQATYLPRIRSGEDVWCQLFSEPDCGSDLAGIKARAEARPDGSWVLSGQKTWTTDGHWAQMGVALLRTSVGARRHDGLTAFLVPMKAEHLEVRPKLTIGGAYEFNDVFLDGVILGPEAQLGQVGGGWAVAMSGLEIERFGVGGNVLLLAQLLGDLVAVAAGLDVDGRTALEHDDIRAAIAALTSDAAAARSFVHDHVDRALSGADDPTDGSIAKLLHTETYNRISRYGASMLAEHGPAPARLEKEAERLLDAWLWSRALTISGGSSEVMRNIIARRRLGLPQ